jgi:hypothetical protein
MKIYVAAAEVVLRYKRKDSMKLSLPPKIAGKTSLKIPVISFCKIFIFVRLMPSLVLKN